MNLGYYFIIEYDKRKLKKYITKNKARLSPYPNKNKISIDKLKTYIINPRAIWAADGIYIKYTINGYDYCLSRYYIIDKMPKNTLIIHQIKHNPS